VLTGSMKGMVALSGLECMSTVCSCQVRRSRFHPMGEEGFASLEEAVGFLRGKSASAAPSKPPSVLRWADHFLPDRFCHSLHTFDGTLGRSLVGNLASIGFTQFPGGIILFWAYQVLAVILLATASMTGLQDASPLSGEMLPSVKS